MSANNADEGQARGRRRYGSTPNQYASPILREIDDLVASQPLSAIQLAAKVGVCRLFFNNIRRGVSPGFANVEALANTLGYDIRLVKRVGNDDGEVA